MPDQIDAVLSQPVTGPNASVAYAVPIEMTQSLLGTIGDASMIVRDPGVDAYYHDPYRGVRRPGRRRQRGSAYNGGS